jgi:hypothetical protein
MEKQGNLRKGLRVNAVELRDLGEAKAYVAHGLVMARAATLTPGLWKLSLETALALAGAGDPLPPPGFLADLCHALLGEATSGPARDLPAVPGWPADAVRRYEDFVLGKLTSDPSIERASDALKTYAAGERARGVAFVARQVRERTRIDGVNLPPAVIRQLLAAPAADGPRLAKESLAESGPHPLLIPHAEALVAAVRRTPDLLGPDEVAALDQRMALADFGQLVAYRQILRTAAALEAELPNRPPPPRPGRTEVPTRVLDDDVYPVGGYSSIGTKGTIESLLHSQLAYLEDGPGPDLFAVKFVRDELFYYTRDENQFRRRRRAFAIRLDPSLVESRVKDPDAPVQRVVFAVAATLVVVRKLLEWLTADALRIDLVVPTTDPKNPLAHESDLLTTLLRDAIEREAVAVSASPPAELAARFETLARTHQFHSLLVTANEPPADAVPALRVAARPAFTDSDATKQSWPVADATTAWAGAVRAVLEEWV